MPKKKIKQGVRVQVKCPKGHPADSSGRCYKRGCQYSAQSGAPEPKGGA